MSRLMKVEQKGKKLYRVVLDSEGLSCNYIETTTGVDYNLDSAEHRCIKCLSVVNWIHWSSRSHAKSTCHCGQEQTLSLINLDNEPAIELRK